MTAPGEPGAGRGRRARSLARRLALQALYRIQINPGPWQDTHAEFARDPEAARVDRDYFRELLMAVAERRAEFDGAIERFGEIAPRDLDPVEHAVLWLGLYELQSRPELPYRVALAEAVELTKHFGATDAHKYVNAVLDRAARELRPLEYGQARD
ncbi:MAG TPA: transcription antitermination factor NusB [Steroidobacteraceae bacterium]|nr:transcription antitermination factor NusB [Steroidobacteraceae bacterium]